MPMAASNSATAAKIVNSVMLKFWRAVELEMTCSMVRILETGNCPCSSGIRAEWLRIGRWVPAPCEWPN